MMRTPEITSEHLVTCFLGEEIEELKATSDNAPWRCPECGHPNEDHAILCHGCGWDSSRP
jgi:hypothetical protein